MLQVILDNRGMAQTVFIVAMLLFAWRRGAGPERAVALTFVGMKIFTEFSFALRGATWSLNEIDIPIAIIDLIACAVLVYVGLNANRMYTLWIAAFQIIALNAHVVREIASGISPIAYAIMYVAPSYFQLLILCSGIWCHSRRQQRYGPYRSWRLPSNVTKLA